MNPYEVQIRDRARIHTVYKLRDGTRVPSVTEVLDELAKPYLVDWAWKLGTEGINYKDIQEQYSNVGTLAHAMIHAYIKKKEILEVTGYSNPVFSLANMASLSFLAWEKDYKVVILQSEMPLVSGILKYGGTLDLLASINGKVTLVDFKTGPLIYPVHFVQLAGYQHLVSVNFPDINIERFMIVNLDRNETGYTVKTKHSLLNEWKRFLAALQICKLRKEIEK